LVQAFQRRERRNPKRNFDLQSRRLNGNPPE
jgi:hypothetical protein